jgi:hypothetical protein
MGSSLSPSETSRSSLASIGAPTDGSYFSAQYGLAGDKEDQSAMAALRASRGSLRVPPDESGGFLNMRMRGSSSKLNGSSRMWNTPGFAPDTVDSSMHAAVTAARLAADAKWQEDDKKMKRKGKGDEDGEKEGRNPYVAGGHRLLNTQIDISSDASAIDHLGRIDVACYLGGRLVQDLAAASPLWDAISELLQSRLSAPEYTAERLERRGSQGHAHGPAPPPPHTDAPHTDAPHEQPLESPRESSRGGSSRPLTVSSALGFQAFDADIKVSPRLCIAALRALESLCRDHVANQKMAFTRGHLMELLELAVVPAITKAEKKWMVHVLFVLLLGNADAQDKVIKCVFSQPLKDLLARLNHASEWLDWPSNEAALLSQLLGWEPLKVLHAGTNEIAPSVRRKQDAPRLHCALPDCDARPAGLPALGLPGDIQPGRSSC